MPRIQPVLAKVSSKLYHNRPDPDPHPRGTPRLPIRFPERIVIRLQTNDLVLGDVRLLEELASGQIMFPEKLLKAAVAVKPEPSP